MLIGQRMMRVYHLLGRLSNSCRYFSFFWFERERPFSFKQLGTTGKAGGGPVRKRLIHFTLCIRI